MSNVPAKLFARRAKNVGKTDGAFHQDGRFRLSRRSGLSVLINGYVYQDEPGNFIKMNGTGLS